MKGRSVQGVLVVGVAASIGILLKMSMITPAAAITPARASNQAVSIRFLALGDVNLGRSVGQQILKGDTLYPFAQAAPVLQSFDIVFANLESNLSDQKGETQHPKYNLIFTGPPAGGYTLRRGGVTVVSTANNHALDYGRAARDETIRYLEEAGVAYAGTSRGADSLFVPAILERKGIRMAVFACTGIMNAEGNAWRRSVAAADTGLLLASLRRHRQEADVIVVSYHGGAEYVDQPDERTRDFARAVLRGGADIFLGHHSHVPQGIEMVEGKPAIYSLGNFVFRQPQHYWTQLSFGFACEIQKDSTGISLTRYGILPLRAGSQPEFLPAGPAADTVLARVRALSRVPVGYSTW